MNKKKFAKILNTIRSWKSRDIEAAGSGKLFKVALEQRDLEAIDCANDVLDLLLRKEAELDELRKSINKFVESNLGVGTKVSLLKKYTLGGEKNVVCIPGDEGVVEHLNENGVVNVRFNRTRVAVDVNIADIKIINKSIVDLPQVQVADGCGLSSSPIRFDDATRYTIGVTPNSPYSLSWYVSPTFTCSNT